MRNNREKPWTEEELTFLKENVERLCNQQIGEVLGRSREAIRSRFRRLGLRRSTEARNRFAILNRPDFSGENNPGFKNWRSKDNMYYRRLSLQRYPERNAIRKRVLAAIRRGDIVRKPCEVCGSSRTDAHHDDYNKPYEVRFLCRKHHNQWHRENTPIYPIEEQIRLATYVANSAN